MPYLFKARFSVIAVIKSTYSGGPVLKTPVSTVGGTSSVPGWETKIPHAIQLKKEICFLNKEIYKFKKKTMYTTWRPAQAPWLNKVWKPLTLHSVRQVSQRPFDIYNLSLTSHQWQVIISVGFPESTRKVRPLSLMDHRELGLEVGCLWAVNETCEWMRGHRAQSGIM